MHTKVHVKPLTHFGLEPEGVQILQILNLNFVSVAGLRSEVYKQSL
jgi:hypothetical protein